MTILPKSKKEGTIFSVLMCDLMVLGVRSYNLSIHDALTADVIFAGFPLEFIVAFILDVFVVGVVAKKSLFACPYPSTNNLHDFNDFVPNDFGHDEFHAHLQFNRRLSSWHLVSVVLISKLIYQNFVVALPYQLLIVGPFSRNILHRVQISAVKAYGPANKITHANKQARDQSGGVPVCFPNY